MNALREDDVREQDPLVDCDMAMRKGASDGRQGDIHGDTLCVDGSQVGVLEKRDEVSLGSFLEGHDGGGLETEISL